MIGICPVCCLEPCRCGDAQIGRGTPDASAERAQATPSLEDAKEQLTRIFYENALYGGRSLTQEARAVDALILAAQSPLLQQVSQLQEENQRLRKEIALNREHEVGLDGATVHAKEELIRP